MHTSIFISPSFEDMVFNKALEMVRSGQSEGILDDEIFGGIRVFIDKKPTFSLMHFEGSASILELRDKSIYVGAMKI